MNFVNDAYEKKNIWICFIEDVIDVVEETTIISSGKKRIQMYMH